MITKPRIFVGSSSEALKVAKLVEDVIRQAGMEPALWSQEAFVLGRTLLETIESLPFDYQGAVLLLTPDVECTRGKDHYSAPVENVVFEYGYLAARLTRSRVAICTYGKGTYGKVRVPSDLLGMKLVEAGDGPYPTKHSPRFRPGAKRELANWLKKFTPLTAGIPPISQVHGYTGTWHVRSRFSLWRGEKVKKNDKVYFDGKTFLVLQNGGERGSGVQIGKLHILIGEYRATYEIVNEVLTASVDEQGTLRMRIRLVRREGPKGQIGRIPDARLREKLATSEFDIELKPVPGQSATLEGVHDYRSANKIYQKAKEHFEYSALFGACCL